MKKYLKIAVYSGDVLSFFNTYVDSLLKYGRVNPEVFESNAYSEEISAANTSILH